MTINRRGLLIGAGGGVLAAVPALARPVPFMQLRRTLYSLDEITKAESWVGTVNALGPKVRLTFPNGYGTRWMSYTPNCFMGPHYGGPATALEVSIWAPNGMRAVSIIPLSFEEHV